MMCYIKLPWLGSIALRIHCVYSWGLCIENGSYCVVCCTVFLLIQSVNTININICIDIMREKNVMFFSSGM